MRWKNKREMKNNRRLLESYDRTEGLTVLEEIKVLIKPKSHWKIIIIIIIILIIIIITRI